MRTLDVTCASIEEAIAELEKPVFGFSGVVSICSDPVGFLAGTDYADKVKRVRELLECLRAAPVLHLHFDDVQVPRAGFVHARHLDVSLAVAFARVRMDGRVLVHCAAGSSRSTAIGVAMLIASGAAPEEALAYIYSTRDGADPNTLVLSLTETLFELSPGSLVSAAKSLKPPPRGYTW